MFGDGGEHGAERDVVDHVGVVFGGTKLFGGVGGIAENGRGSEDATGVGWSEVVLPDVQGCAEKGGVIGAVVHDEEYAGGFAEGGYGFGQVKYFARPEGFVAKLENARAAFDKRFGRGEGGEVDAVQGGRVENWIDAGQGELGQGPI